jgi:translation initiation factor 1
MDICPKCGLPIAACVCEEIAKTQQEVEVRTEKRRFGKVVTLVSGLEGVDLKEVAKKLKNKLACGGTIDGKVIELQGNHLVKVKPVLVEAGFSESLIKEKR